MTPAVSAFDFSTIDLSTFGATFMAAITVTIGVSITYIAVKKGISMLKKALKGA